MYPSATDGGKPNNDKFSDCSIGNFSQVLNLVRHLCIRIFIGLYIYNNKLLCRDYELVYELGATFESIL